MFGQTPGIQQYMLQIHYYKLSVFWKHYIAKWWFMSLCTSTPKFVLVLSSFANSAILEFISQRRWSFFFISRLVRFRDGIIHILAMCWGPVQHRMWSVGCQWYSRLCIEIRYASILCYLRMILTSRPVVWRRYAAAEKTTVILIVSNTILSFCRCNPIQNSSVYRTTKCFHNSCLFILFCQLFSRIRTVSIV